MPHELSAPRLYSHTLSYLLYRMSLKRHASHYALIGALQWLLDWGVMVALSHNGWIVGYANIAGRIAGALLGYWLNGKITFADADTDLGRKQLARFIVMWLVMTTISTVCIEHIDDVFGLRWVWLAKPVIELALGITGFILSRHWIYKR